MISLKKITAGWGYDYLIRQVAAQDVLDDGVELFDRGRLEATAVLMMARSTPFVFKIAPRVLGGAVCGPIRAVGPSRSLPPNWPRPGPRGRPRGPIDGLDRGVTSRARMQSSSTARRRTIRIPPEISEPARAPLH